uniref:Protein kinase domain-containing protein n=1 Tax=Sphaeramia orbicularis TaxID=375764 RepID=A0A672Y9M8_9TELE
MTPKTLGTARLEPAPLFSDPWDNELISGLLSALNPPLTSHPHCISWQGNVPNIRPRTTISMGKASLRVDCILGEGAFATVYQATDPMTSERMVLKVQKPANPWEFYINTQLDVRLQPNIRHLYSRLSSAHLFHDGSVLLGELHSYGTLLNVVNLYKCGSDKVMPQPLVLYFSICILHMVEQLHSVNIIHADIKPDNFLLGERQAPVLIRTTWTTAWSSSTSDRASTWSFSHEALLSPPPVRRQGSSAQRCRAGNRGTTRWAGRNGTGRS